MLIEHVVHVVKEETVKVHISGPLKGQSVAARASLSSCVQVEQYVMKANKRMREINSLLCENLKSVYVWLGFGLNYCARSIHPTL